MLAHVSCLVTVRKRKMHKRGLRRGHHHKVIRMTLVSAHIRQFGSRFGLFDIAG